jgi:adenylate cyclase
MGSGGEEAFKFEGFVLDLTRGCLTNAVGEIGLRPKNFELLRYLVENAGRLISKDELVNAIWPNLTVSDASLAQCVSELRHALNDLNHRAIKTVPRRGYLFVAPVSIDRAHTPHIRRVAATLAGDSGPYSPAVGADEQAAPVPLMDKPSIAVLPFANLSGNPEQEYFADGMVEEIITALSRIRWLLVVARNSSFMYKGQTVDVKRIGRELGVRYVLEGSVRKGGNRVRITGQLIDAVSGTHLWADRFDGLIEDVFELQDKVASSVAGVIEPTLQSAETARSVGRPTPDLTAYDLYLRAYAMVLSSTRQTPESLRLMEQAIARDPRYGPALAWAAVCCVRLLTDGRSEDATVDALKATDFARRALEVAGDDPCILANVALALACVGEDIGATIALVDRALVLNPNFARGWQVSGTLRMFAGQPDLAIEHVNIALRLSPRARSGTSLEVIGAAHFYARRFDKAVPTLLLAMQEDPGNPQPYRYLAACYAHTGRLDDAREIIKRLRSLTSIVVPDVTRLRNPEHRCLYLSGLRLAAGEMASLPLTRCR